MSLYDSLAPQGARMLSFEMSHNFGICSIQRTIQVFKKASGLKKINIPPFCTLVVGKFIKSGIILLPSCHLTRDFNLNLRQVRRPLVKSYSLQETVSILTLSPCRQKYDCHGDADQSASR